MKEPVEIRSPWLELVANKYKSQIFWQYGQSIFSPAYICDKYVKKLWNLPKNVEAIRVVISDSCHKNAVHLTLEPSLCKVGLNKRSPRIEICSSLGDMIYALIQESEKNVLDNGCYISLEYEV